MTELKPNVVERIERFSLNREEIEELVKAGFLQGVFLDGRPGTAQRVEYSFDLGHCPTATITVTTLEQEYTERG